MSDDNDVVVDDVLFARALELTARAFMGDMKGKKAFEAAKQMMRPHVEAALSDVLERRYQMVTQLLEMVEDRNAKDDLTSNEPDARFRAGYETGLAFAALWFGVDAAASPQRRTELPAWLEAHKGEDR